MFRRSRSGAQPARRARSVRSAFSFRRKPLFELLEQRRLLAGVTVSNNNDVVNGTVTSIAALIATPGPDGISLREAITAANTNATADVITFSPSLNGDEIVLTVAKGDLDITNPLTIDAGALVGGLTINANDPTPAMNNGDGIRIFNIDNGNVATDSPVTIIGLTLTGGDVTGRGGAIHSLESLTLRFSAVTGNAASDKAGGLYMKGSSLTHEITNTSVSSNATGTSGGGIYLQQGTATITNTTISGNTAADFSGGMSASVANTTISNSTISGNTSGLRGGGIYFNYGTSLMTNSTVSGNRSDTDGGGIGGRVGAGSSITIRHSTITLNESDEDAAGGGSGGGIFLGSAGSIGAVTLEHTIVAGNFDNSNVAPDLDNTTAATDPTLTARFNLIGDVTGSGLVAANPDGNGNRIGTGAAPINAMLGLLANNGGRTNTHRLLPGSPALDTGDPAIAMPPANDQRGAPFVRVFDGALPLGAVIDIGAYELQNFGVAQAHIVDILADESDGNFAPGDLSLREAIGLANGNVGFADTITFALGLNGGTITLLLGQLSITDAVSINAQNLGAGITIDASGNDPTPNSKLDDANMLDDGDGSRIFDINDSLTPNVDVTLNNLILTGGDPAGSGGAIRSIENLRILDSTITGNNAGADGGGILAIGNLTILRSTLTENAGYAGGGAYFRSLSGNFIITDSTVADNLAINRGGGLAIVDSAAVNITRSTLSGNVSGTRGGGLYLIDSDASTIINSTISGNDANSEGGGIFSITRAGDTTTITHSTITLNRADDDDDNMGSGGGLSANIEGTLNLRHTIIAENIDKSDAAPDLFVALDPAGTFNRSFNLIGNNMGSGLAAGNPNGNGNRIGTNAAPLDPGLEILLDNGGPTLTHMLELGSLAIDNGDPAAMAGVGGIPDFDQRGNPFPRVFDGNGAGGPRIDIGAFEVTAFELVAPDDFEPNNTQLTATRLGSEPFVTLRDLSITAGNGDNIPNDVDFFKYTAHYTGKLDVRILFQDDFGDLDLEVLDKFGNLLAESKGVEDDEEVIIPVVFQEMYFIRVFGFLPVGEDIAAANNYVLEVENFPAPVPTGVHLDPASDTGMMNNDNITSDTTPTFFIQTDVLNFVDTNNDGIFQDPDGNPNDDLIEVLLAEDIAEILAGQDPMDETDSGIGVEITLVNTTTGMVVIGHADPVALMFPEVFRFTPTVPLTPGVYLVSARTKVFDAQENAVGNPAQKMGRSNASPPLWITIDNVAVVNGSVSADLLPSSDSGMFNNDDVTNKMQPAFQGIAPAGFKVRLFANGDLVGQTVAGSDTSDVGHAVGGIGGLPNDGLGLWEITTEPLTDDIYDITIEIEDAAGNIATFNPIFHPNVPPVDIVIDTVDPNTPLLDLLTDTGRHSNDNITKDTTPDVSMTTTDPNAVLARRLFTDNLKFRIFDRFQNSAQEVLIYDSALDAVADAFMTPGDMFTAFTQLTRTLPVLTPINPAIVGMALANGVHNLKLEVEDRAGNISHDFLLQITVDNITPPVSFGLPDAASLFDGLTAQSDTGSVTMPMTFADRATSDTTPRLWGRAEADTNIRVFLDRNNNGVIDLLIDTFVGQTVAVPFDGNDAFPDGYWEITTVLDLNEVPGMPKDGLRRLLVTAEDVAGNPMPMNNVITDGVDELQIFIDTQGPQVTDLEIPDFPNHDLFDPKPSTNGYTPLIRSLKISVQDLPNRLDQAGGNNDFLYEALKFDNAFTSQIDNASNPGNYLLVGDHVGTIAIQSVTVMSPPVISGNPALAMVTLTFFAPLPDDRYTLTIRDSLVDPVGNKLDGESNASEPQGEPLFPTGDGVPGGNFVARFTIDSRPEIGSYVSQAINLDINGNFVWDPANAQIGNDATNVDLSFTLPAFENGNAIAGNLSPHELLVAGKFRPIGYGNGNGGIGIGGNGVAGQRFFDQLASYGNYAGVFRWLIDLDSDGVVYGNGDPDGINDLIVNQAAIGGFNIAGAIPIAGNFDGNLNNGDEIGLYYSGSWAIDTNHDFVINTVLTGNLLGHPIVGDFDGNGTDDFAVFNNNVFSFGFNLSPTKSAEIIWGFPGVLDRPVAADMDQDGIDDIGIWVPRNSANPPRVIAEWYFRVSNAPVLNARSSHYGTVHYLNHGFSPPPFGADLYAEFGDELALPIVGNFDPPSAAASLGGGPELAGDYDRNGVVNQSDRMVWRAGFGSTTNLAADGNLDGRVDAADYAIWRNNLGRTAASASALILDAGRAVEPAYAALLTEVTAQSSAPTDESAADAAEVDRDDDRLAAVDGLFASLDPARPARQFRPALARELASEDDDLLLVDLSTHVVRPPASESTGTAYEEESSDDIFDELLAEFVGVGDMFE